jgi:TolB-like protein/tetratricopeptide (TPR) repeat protein
MVLCAPLARDALAIESLITELKRRRVFRVMVGYGLVAFALLQVIEPIQHGLHLPDSLLTYLVVALGAGFPVVITFGWAFDVTARGIERAAPAPGVASSVRGARLGAILIALGVLGAAPGLAWYFLRARASVATSTEVTPSSAQLPSIAVLPFTDMSAHHDQEYFSDGIAEEILNALAQVEGLQTAGRTSSFSFKGRNQDLREIGHKLSVANVLEGSVRTSGTHVRITAQLIKVADGFHLWSQTFDREVTDIFAVQDEIAREVVGALKVKLLAGQGGLAKERRSASPEAYAEYLKGLQSQRLGTLQGHREAIAAYRRAIQLDPNYAPPRAWLGLAQAGYLSLANVPSLAQFEEYEREARPESDRAIALAPQLADGYLSRGWLRLTFAWEWAGAQADLERARAISPGDPDVLLRNALLLAALGRVPEAIALARTALDRDPFSILGAFFLGSFYNAAGQHALARAVLQEGLAAAPGAGFVAREMAFTELYEGKPAAALERFDQHPQPVVRSYGRAMALHSLGRAQESQQALDELIASNGQDGAYQVAQVFAWRADRDQAFEWLERARSQHDTGLRAVKYDRLLRALRGDARYTVFLQKLSLPVD